MSRNIAVNIDFSSRLFLYIMYLKTMINNNKLRPICEREERDRMEERDRWWIAFHKEIYPAVVILCSMKNITLIV